MEVHFPYVRSTVLLCFADLYVSLRIVPLVSIPIQLRYRVSFFAMYVFPLAGNPTRTITHGAIATFAMSGHNAEKIKIK